MGDKYILRYLPLFYEDLEEKITYISDELANPEAALGLLDAVEAAILKRLLMLSRLSSIILKLIISIHTII